MNSVNAPGSVATSILPAMLPDNDVMSYREASSVPSPVGLVVKKGLNIFSLISDEMSAPTSPPRAVGALSGVRYHGVSSP